MQWEREGSGCEAWGFEFRTVVDLSGDCSRVFFAGKPLSRACQLVDGYRVSSGNAASSVHGSVNVDGLSVKQMCAVPLGPLAVLQ